MHNIEFPLQVDLFKVTRDGSGKHLFQGEELLSRKNWYMKGDLDAFNY